MAMDVVLKHNICGDQSEVLDVMPGSFDPLPLEFFTNPRCPGPRKRLRSQQGEATKEHKKSASAGNQS